MKRILSAGLIVMVLLSSFALPPIAVMADDEVIVFSDPNLEQAIREAIEKPIGDIYQSDLGYGLNVYKNLPKLQLDAFFFQFDINPSSTMVGSGLLDGNGIPYEFFSDIDVRKGFAYAFDWETYVCDALYGEAQKPNSPIIEGLSYYNPSFNLEYSMDLGLAEQYLRMAWNGDLWDEGFTMTLAYNQGNFPRQVACEILKENLNSINPLFNINVVEVSNSNYVFGAYTGQLPMFQYGWISDYPDAHNFVYPFMDSDGIWPNWQHYGNQDIDNLIEQAIISTDPTERQSIYDDLSQIYFDECLSILLDQPLNSRFFKNWVTGFSYNPAIRNTLGRTYDLSFTGEAPRSNFVYASMWTVDSLDPAYVYDSYSQEVLLNVIYETIITFNGDSTTDFVPTLATEWTVSEDGLTYRFRIRDDVTFHNGNTLTPEDVEYSFERAMVQDYMGSPIWMLFEPFFGPGISSEDLTLDEIKTPVNVDGEWVQFDLVTPFEPFLQILCGSWSSIVDKEWCIANGDWDGTQESFEELNNPAPHTSPLQSIANGTGPFYLGTWVPGVETVLFRNDDYWRGPANFEELDVVVVPDWDDRKDMLIDGEVDIIDVFANQVHELEGLIVLDASNRIISDITGIEHCTNLEYLDLSFNRIRDVFPLVTNEGLGEGDVVNLLHNPLNLESLVVYVPMLRDRGVTVEIANYPPLYVARNMIIAIEAFNINQGIQNNLISKLDDVMNFIGQGKIEQAINKLGDFINTCEAQSGKKLSVYQADLLISGANMLILQLEG